MVKDIRVGDLLVIEHGRRQGFIMIVIEVGLRQGHRDLIKGQGFIEWNDIKYVENLMQQNNIFYLDFVEKNYKRLGLGPRSRGK